MIPDLVISYPNKKLPSPIHQLRPLDHTSYGPKYWVKVKPVNIDTFYLTENISQLDCNSNFYRNDDDLNILNRTLKDFKELESRLSQQIKEYQEEALVNYKVLLSDVADFLQTIKKKYRLGLLNLTYTKNKRDKEIPKEMEAIRKETDNIVSDLPFEDCGVNFNTSDQAWDYTLIFPHELRVRLTIFDDDGIDNVDYFINLKGKLLVADSLPLKEIEEKLNSILGNE